MASVLRPAARRLVLSSIRPNTFIRSSIIPQTRVAAFHATQKKHILPPGPQIIHGSVNDPTPVPEPNSAHGSYHWAFERLISIIVVPLTVAPFVMGSGAPLLDAAIASSMLIHSHIGFDACVTDYFNYRLYPKLTKMMNWLLRISTVTVAVGLFSFQTNDVGLTESIKRVWKA